MFSFTGISQSEYKKFVLRLNLINEGYYTIIRILKR